MTPETAIKKSIKYILNLHGWFNFPILQGMGAYPGIADMIAVKDGRVLFLEVKTPKGRQSDKQILFGSRVNGHGGEYHVVRSVEDVARIIGVRIIG